MKWSMLRGVRPSLGSGLTNSCSCQGPSSLHIKIVAGFGAGFVSQKIGLGHNTVAGINFSRGKNRSSALAVDVGQEPTVVNFHLLMLVSGHSRWSN